MDVRSKIESLLPGAWSKAIFFVSIGLSAVLYIRFPDLPSSWLPTSESEKYLIRILLSGLILLLGSVSLTALLMYHNRKITVAFINSKSENTAYFHQVSSLNTDNNTLQSLLDETKQTLDHLTKKHISLLKANTDLTEQNKEQTAKIEMLSTAADSFRDEARQLRTQATEIQKELTSLKAEYNGLRQRNAGTEALAIMRGRQLEQCQKELDDLKKSPTVQQVDMKGWT